ncbi:MAG: class I SAM-dependent methyltransferase [Leptolyngbyaceae cyanobacterium RM2_2_4]|nr:class I SAM-dependent methyltransferase [Leptolyngbyaceae cyanobacterium SM1_4_3]NJO50185.1 class I SAM-dependent methyltransferase [Leptolyngbyaceae cyanobacterium RM2_2_4]
MISVQSCTLCGSKNLKLFDQSEFKGYSVTNWLCQYCGLVTLSPRLSDEELAEFYSAEYRQMYQGSQEPTAKDLEVQRGRAKHLAELAREALPQCRSHLDIGCSAGLLMQAIAQTHCTTIGVEPGDAYRNYCIHQGLTVYPNLETLKVKQPDKFDLITMSHVLEHISDPVDYLIMLRTELLNSSGILLIEVPNLYGHNCFEIAHSYSFSPHTLKQTLQKAGFAVEQMKQHCLPRKTTRLLYLTAIARPFSHPSTAYRVRRNYPWLVYLHREAGLKGISAFELLQKRTQKRIDRLFNGSSN